jgi:hypothetical protein
MSLTIFPADKSYQKVFDLLVANLPNTNFLVKAPIIVPYMGDNETAMLLMVSPYSSLDFDSDKDSVDVYLNGVFLYKIYPTQPITQVSLKLPQGRSQIDLRSATYGTFTLYIAATKVATYNAAWAEQFYNEVFVQLQHYSLQLNSNFSLAQVEHQLPWQDMLPATRVHRILAGKMAIRSLFAEGGTDRGVLDIASAVSGSTPFVLPTKMDKNEYEPECKLLYSQAHEFAGYEFNLWLFNLCAVSWQAFIILANNLPDDVMKLQKVTESKVTLLSHNQSILESHHFDFGDQSCNIFAILNQFLDCLGNFKVWVKQSSLIKVSICPFSNNTDTLITIPVGTSFFDLGKQFDEPKPLDSCELSDPYCDGLLGMPIGCPFDSGASIPQVTNFNDLCALTPAKSCQPCTSLVVTSLANLSAHINLGVTSNMNSSFQNSDVFYVGTGHVTSFHPLSLLDSLDYPISATLGVYDGFNDFMWAVSGNLISSYNIVGELQSTINFGSFTILAIKKVSHQRVAFVIGHDPSIPIYTLFKVSLVTGSIISSIALPSTAVDISILPNSGLILVGYYGPSVSLEIYDFNFNLKSSFQDSNSINCSSILAITQTRIYQTSQSDSNLSLIDSSHKLPAYVTNQVASIPLPFFAGVMAYDNLKDGVWVGSVEGLATQIVFVASDGTVGTPIVLSPSGYNVVSLLFLNGFLYGLTGDGILFMLDSNGILLTRNIPSTCYSLFYNN